MAYLLQKNVQNRKKKSVCQKLSVVYIWYNQINQFSVVDAPDGLSSLISTESDKYPYLHFLGKIKSL